VRQQMNEGDVRLFGLKLGLVNMRFVGLQSLRAGAVERLVWDYGSAQITRSLLMEKKLDCNVAVGRFSIDRGRMHVASGLKPYLTIHEFVAHVWLARRVDGDLSVARHDTDRIYIMPVQQNGFMRRYHDLIHVHVFVVEREMVMRFGGEWNSGRRLRGHGQWKTTHRE
jgi:hypothetical protein